MKIPKAIEILTDIKENDPELYMNDEQDALKLGIAALERMDNARLLGMDYPLNLLPGEDKPK